MILVPLIAVGALHTAWSTVTWPHLTSPLPLTLPTEGMRRRAGYKTRTRAYHLDGWDMRIERDGFTGQVRCRLFAPAGLAQGRISYADETLGFHLNPKEDAAQAWYSIDDKPPRPWRMDYPALVARRISLEGGGLANPTGGVVLIGQDLLAGAQTVTIRASPDSMPKRFRLKGFVQALAAARANGCAEPGAFVRDPL